MKPILLQTTPHTGTRTCEYLYNYLGRIPTYYMHFGDWDMSEFLSEFHDLRERFTVVHTMRPYPDVVATYRKRVPEYAKAPEHPNSAENLVKRNLEVARVWQEEFSDSLIQPLGVGAFLQTGMARQIFKACDVEVPDTAKRFLETWPPKGTFPTGSEDDLHGWDDEREFKEMSHVMQHYRIMPSNDWHNRVNLSLKELSN